MEISIFDEDLERAIASAYYNAAELDALLLYGLKKPLETIPGFNADLSLNEQIRLVLKWARAKRKLDAFFAAALARRRGNPELKAFAAKIARGVSQEQQQIADELKADWVKSTAHASAATARQRIASHESLGGVLEALVVGAANFTAGMSAMDWMQKMDRCRRQVCMITRQGVPAGTGFLIGPDRVMTNSHVVKEPGGDGYCAVFEAGGIGAATTCAFTAELARSEPRQFDYAIFRLQSIPAGNRGFCAAGDHKWVQHESLIVLGYPGGGELVPAFGVLFDSNSFMGRVAYTANTYPGSSGSPVFDGNWDLVAIHHHGEENINNHGIPISAIRADLKDNADLFGARLILKP